MSVKNTGKFAQVQRILNENGEYEGVIRARVTDDIVLKKGQTVFFNEIEEEMKALVERNFISAEEADERLNKRKQLDKEYNQETVYSLRAGKLPEETNTKGNRL